MNYSRNLNNSLTIPRLNADGRAGLLSVKPLLLAGQKHFQEEKMMRTQAMPEQNESAAEKALEKAAKIICTLKCGRCPMQEKNFPGCPSVCHEDIVPWQCWVSYLRATA